MEAELKEVFALFDKDGGGTITQDEIGAVLKNFGIEYSDSQLKTILKSIDTDGNGEIDFGEFCAMMQDDTKVDDPEAELKYAFSVFDKDDDGEITADEIMKVMNQLNQTIDKGTVDLMLQSVDVDGDGTVSYAEFKKMMRDGPVTFK